MANSSSNTPKVGTPRTPLRSPASRNYPFSSPYTSNTPIALPIHPPLMIKSDDALDPDLITTTPIGCAIDELPFLTDEIQHRLKTSYGGVLKNLTRLNKFNNIIVDMNESVDAYLFGLFQNAWCVHFDKTPSEDHWKKFHELEKLKLEARELEVKIRTIRDKKRRDSQRMPPPPSRNSFRNPHLRISKPPIINKSSRLNRLKLGMAKKVESQQQIDSSFESNASDTTGFINHPEAIRQSKPSNPFKSLRVKHKKPFR